MKRLVFIVEGDSEVSFVNNIVIPYLYNLGFTNPMNAQPVITNRKQHKKGGIVNYDLLKNDLQRVFAQGNVIVTTLLDFFKLPPNFPGYTQDPLLIGNIEEAMSEDFDNNPNYIPYIQKHEFEALMFSSIEGFNLIIDDINRLQKIGEIISDFPNPEDINNSPQTAPSKRLLNIFRYDKVADSELIFEMIGIEAIQEKCPRFKAWLEKLVTKLEED